MFTRRFGRFYWAPDGAGAGTGGDADTGGGGGNPQSDGQQSQSVPTYATLYESLDEAQRGLIDQHITGLKNTVAATRTERDALSQQMADITKALGKNPEEAKRLLDEMSKSLDLANQRAAFAEEAIRPEIGCANPRAALAVAQNDKLFDRRGNPDWTAIKQAAPELFRPVVPQGNAGSGTGTDAGPGKPSMDDFIRAKAGIR